MLLLFSLCIFFCLSIIAWFLIIFSYTQKQNALYHLDLDFELSSYLLLLLTTNILLPGFSLITNIVARV